MALKEEHIEQIVAKYVKNGYTIAIGSEKAGEKFLSKLALAIEERNIKVSVVPTSLRMASLASSLDLKITSLNESEIDVAVEFVDQIDEDFNYIKRDSCSLVRDKMIAQSAVILIAIAEENNFVKRLRGSIPFEIATFGWKRTVSQLENFGRAGLRKSGNRVYKTETGHYLVDVAVDPVYELFELECDAKNIPGVLETGLFLGYADKIVLHNKGISVKSRTEFR